MEVWKKCSSCKADISYGGKHYICSVSSCNGLRTGYVFCSTHCFERHLPGARHRDAAAIEEVAPKSQAASSPARRIIPQTQTASAASAGGAKYPREVLIVASKLKDYIRARSEMNTSGNVLEILSEIVRRKCDEAIENARIEGRKTVMDRDFKF